MKPILRGIVARVDGEPVTWQGVWGMREADLENEAVRAPFRYERVGERTHELSGPYAGSFTVRTAAGGTKYTDKRMDLVFTDAEVTGTGANKIGKFSLQGSLDAASGVLTLYREYAPRHKPNASEVKARVQRELGILGDALSAPKPSPAATDPGTSPPAAVASSASSPAADVVDEAYLGLALAKLNDIVQELMRTEDKHKWFCSPVDADRLGLRDYHGVVSRPMDLGTVSRNFAAGSYASLHEMHTDVAQTFANALLYNERGSPVYREAARLQALVDERFAALLCDFTPPGLADKALAPPRVSGKRQRVRKVAFEAQFNSKYHNEKPEQLPASSSAVEAAAPARKQQRRRKSSATAASAEVRALQEQVRRMSQHMQIMNDGYFAGVPGMVDDFGLHQPDAITGSQRKRSLFGNGAEQLQLQQQAQQRAMSVDAKRTLGRDIYTLPGDALQRVVGIIQESGVALPVSSSGEVELELDALNDETLRKLRKYVTRKMSASR